MSLFRKLMSAAASAPAAAEHPVDNSLRLRANAEAYLSQTPVAPGSATTWTLSAWIKRGALSSNLSVFHAGVNNGPDSFFYFDTGNTFDWIVRNAGAVTIARRISTAVFGDPTAHYHFVWVWDTTNSTAADRMRIYVNGERVTAFSTTLDPSPSMSSPFNTAVAHNIGRNTSGVQHFDGYLSEIHFVDGQALTPASFGVANADGVWVPGVYAGAYGANGFYLPFDVGTSAAALAEDRSGNGNDWTPTNISVVNDATYDWMEDTPTNNFAVLMPATVPPMSSIGQPISGNLSSPTTTFPVFLCTFRHPPASGKFYWEWTWAALSGSSTGIVGFYTQTLSQEVVSYRTRRLSSAAQGAIYVNGVETELVAPLAVSDVVGVALDSDAGTVQFYKNGVAQGSANAPTGLYDSLIEFGGDNFLFTGHANFGQRPYAHTPPTGFGPLVTARLPDAEIVTSGTFTGNAANDGPVVWLGGEPLTMTINGNAVTFGTHAYKTAGGFKVITSSASYNTAGANTYVVTLTGGKFGSSTSAPNTAKANP